MIDLEEIALNQTLLFLEPRTEFDEAIIGVGEFFSSEMRVTYSYEKVLDVLMTKQEMTYDEAVEWYYYNILGSYLDENMPIFVHELEGN